MQLVRHELIGEAAGKGHQVVGGDGAGDSDTHDGSAPWGAVTVDDMNDGSHQAEPHHATGFRPDDQVRFPPLGT
ncbi:hypothetical protein GCM10010214_50440 [Streptomyces abikoensis]|nr:hypothetical protein GCM10010214_50440 [Streptomyces abikoensis]